MGGLVTRGFFPEIKVVEIQVVPVIYGYGGGEDEIPLEYRNGQFFVLAEINKTIRGRFMIDTGTNISFVSKKIARRADINPESEFLRFRTLSGEFDAPKAILRSISIGKTELTGIPIAIIELDGFDGIIGTSILARYKMTVDPERVVLKLQKIEYSGLE